MFRNRIFSTLLALSAMCAVSVSALAQGSSKPATPKPTTKMAPAKKSGPERDPKTGRFIKKDPKTGSKMAPAKKSGPERDPKTGRFIKKTEKPGTKMAPAKKTGPERDPKTGRFIKKS